MLLLFLQIKCLIFRYLAQQGIPMLEKSIIMQGMNIISLKACGVTVKDFRCFVPILGGLAALPKAYGLKERKKGYFPHAFNTKENRYYKGLYPTLEYYWPDKKIPKEREELLKWHAMQKDKVSYHAHLNSTCFLFCLQEFDMQKELFEYCESDVNILRESGTKFRDEFIATNGIDPFVEAPTIASACNKEFRKNHLQPNTIGLIPAGGYMRREQQSIIATK